MDSCDHMGFEGMYLNSSRYCELTSLIFVYSVDPNLKQVVYMAGVAEGGEAEWDFLWDIYQKASDPTEQGLILYALSCSRQLWILTR